jgi:hypothetical protein
MLNLVIKSDMPIVFKNSEDCAKFPSFSSFSIFVRLAGFMQGQAFKMLFEAEIRLPHKSADNATFGAKPLNTKTLYQSRQLR